MVKFLQLLPLIGAFRLTTLQQKDLSSLVSLEKELFPVDYWTEGTFRSELAKNPKSIKVIKKNSKIIGYVHTEVRKRKLPNGRTVRIGEIGSVAVHKDFQRKNLGEKLFRQGIRTLKKDKASKIIIHTRLDNLAMKNLAEKKFGFKTEKIEKNVYDDGAAAYRMSLS